MVDHYVKLFKVLADKSRLKIVASLNKEPMYVELISERLGLNPSTVSFHLKKLEQNNLVTSQKEQYYVMYYLNKELLDVHIMDAIGKITVSSETLEEREQQYKNKVITTFFQGGKLTSIPVQRKKREIILREIAKRFDFEKEYQEKEVNLIISDVHYDFCTIRREFIMNKLFSREDGIYKRLQ
jgi:hypothetical protein